MQAGLAFLLCCCFLIVYFTFCSNFGFAGDTDSNADADDVDTVDDVDAVDGAWNSSVVIVV